MKHRSAFQQSLRLLPLSVLCLLLTGCSLFPRTPECDPSPNARLRIAVLTPDDQTGRFGRQVSALGVMLHTELTNCKQFTVIDIGEFAKRHAIPLSNDAETINTLLRRARATAILRTAITKYDPASRKLEGGGFIPGGKHGLKTATTGNAEVIMFKIGLDLRVVDSKTGQVLNATSVEEGGKSYITKVDVVGLQPEQGPFLQTPRGDLRFMQNFDLEGTLRAAIKKAVKELAEKSQANRRAA